VYIGNSYIISHSTEFYLETTSTLFSSTWQESSTRRSDRSALRLSIVCLERSSKVDYKGWVKDLISRTRKR
jgi:hypothetical protein